MKNSRTQTPFRRENIYSTFLGIICFFSVCCLSAPQAVWAETLDEAKAKGLVGETQTGYLGSVTPSPSSSISALIADINAKRKEQYFAIAQKNGTPLSAVEALAAKKAIEATPPGQFIQSASGTWSKK